MKNELVKDGLCYEKVVKKTKTINTIDNGLNNQKAIDSLTADIASGIRREKNFLFHKEISLLKDLKPGFIILFALIIIGGIIGVLYDLIISLLKAGIYINIGMGTTIGLAFGTIIGFIPLLIVGEKLKESTFASSLQAIGLNVILGLITCLLLGVGLGAFYGFIIDYYTVNIIVGTDTLFTGLILISVFSINIGVMTGVIISFGIFKGFGSGLISGLIVGTIGMFTIFGFSWSFALGLLLCVILGLLTGSNLNYSSNPNQAFWIEKMLERSEKRRKEHLAYRRRFYPYRYGFGYYFWGTCLCDADDDCDSSSESDDCGGSLGCILIALAILFPIFLLTAFLNFIAANASYNYGRKVKGQGVPIFFTTIGISTVIGANIGLTTSFHELTIGYNSAICAGLGLVFALLFFCIVILSHFTSSLLISPGKISWQDGETKGSVPYSQIKSIDFDYSFEDRKIRKKNDEEYVVLFQKNGRIKRIRLGIWKESSDRIKPIYIPGIILSYKQKNDKPHDLSDEDVKIIEKRFEETYPEAAQKNLEYTKEDVIKIKDLLEDQPNATVVWLSTVSQLPYGQIIEIVTQYLDMNVHEGKVYTKEKYEEKFGKDNW
jgi:hypothetical protein